MARFPSVGEAFGAYRITSQLGRGGMGVVFAAEQVGLGRTVALKVLSPELADQSDYRQRFAREASVLARVDSPHIISIFDHGEHDGCLYIATQYVAGGDLSAALAAHGPVPAGPAIEVAAQLAYALADAHQAGVVHRDLKPSNVLLRGISSDVFAYLCDFGIAQDRSPGLTVPGAVAGTFAYLAPERTRGEPATPAADLYALGCVLWTALTGATPYAGTDVQIAMAHVNAPVHQLHETSAVAAGVNEVLRTAMAKEPGDRYASAEAMRSALLDLSRLARSTPHPPLAPRPEHQTSFRPDTGASHASQPSQASQPGQPSQPRPPSHPSGAGSFPGPAPTMLPAPPPPPPGGSSAPMWAPGSYAAPQHPPQHPSQPANSRPRRNRTALVVAGAVLAVAVIAGGATAIATSGDDGDPVADPTGSPTLTETTSASTSPTPSPTPSPSPAPSTSTPTTSSSPKPEKATQEPRPFYPKVPASTGLRIALGPASLHTPAGWGSIDDGVVTSGVGARDYADDEGFVTSVFIRRSEPAFPIDDIALLDVVAKGAVTSVGESDKDLTLLETHRLSPAWLDGVQAARIRAAYRSAKYDREVSEETWFLMKGKFLYRVTFQFSRIDTLDERRRVIDPMVVSFRFD
ncbi:hypothetical protein BH09ACT12_BH09ACT12_32100 [soil metagenome]